MVLWFGAIFFILYVFKIAPHSSGFLEFRMTANNTCVIRHYVHWPREKYFHAKFCIEERTRENGLWFIYTKINKIGSGSNVMPANHQCTTDFVCNACRRINSRFRKMVSVYKHTHQLFNSKMWTTSNWFPHEKSKCDVNLSIAKPTLFEHSNFTRMNSNGYFSRFGFNSQFIATL